MRTGLGLELRERGKREDRDGASRRYIQGGGLLLLMLPWCFCSFRRAGAFFSLLTIHDSRVTSLRFTSESASASASASRLLLFVSSAGLS